MSDISELLPEVDVFAARLRKVKESLGGVCEWYRYDSLSVFRHLDKLLTGENRALLSRPGKGAILDIGCADGDLSFFLESLGYDVVAVDHPAYNHNGMRGIRAVKQALGSSVEIQEIDIDRQPTPPDADYVLTLFLGTLYHLRNPLFALEALAKSSRRCLLSTRVARTFPGVGAAPDSASLVYLLDDQELNDDDSNYFIFSNKALQLALRRSHWDILDYMTVGDRAASDPISLTHDERAYCLLRSTYGISNLELGEGWHAPESSGWRWTSRRFAANLRVGKARTLAVKGFLPEFSFAKLGPVRLSVTANGQPLPEMELGSAGIFRYEAHLDRQLGPDVHLHFTLDKALAGSESDPRELGVIIASIGA